MDHSVGMPERQRAAEKLLQERDRQMCWNRGLIDDRFRDDPSGDGWTDHLTVVWSGESGARAIIDNISIHTHLTTAFFKRLLGRPQLLMALDDIDLLISRSRLLMHPPVSRDE
jgi:hypothetical protein